MLLYADLAARTKQIKFAPLALVLPARDPLRAAEQIAYLDHLTKGRVYAGFARGYQQRWVERPRPAGPGARPPRWTAATSTSTTSGSTRSTSTSSTRPGTRTSCSTRASSTKCRSPTTRASAAGRPPTGRGKFGAPGEIDEQGIIRGISVIPKPYQQPHPPAFQPFSVSESTIRHTAKVGVMPMILVSNPPDFRRLCEIYQEVAAENGRTLGLGETVGAFRAVSFGNTARRAWHCWRRRTTSASTPTSPASASGRRSGSPRTPRSTRSIRTRRCRRRSGRWTASST